VTSTLLDHHDAQVVDLDLPWLDDDGLLRHQGSWVAVSPHEEAVLRLFLARWGRMVPRASLAEAVWPSSPSNTRALNTLVGRLRKRLEPLGLTIETIRARGFLMAARHPEPISDPFLAGLAAGVLTEGPSWLIS
jgi:DNA-binding winged helix-turn-helix (wHTH) protein